MGAKCDSEGVPSWPRAGESGGLPPGVAEGDTGASVARGAMSEVVERDLEACLDLGGGSEAGGWSSGGGDMRRASVLSSSVWRGSENCISCW